MRGGDHSYPGLQLAAWNVIEDQLHQIFSCKLFEIGDNSNPTRWTYVISCMLSYHAHCEPIPHQYQ